MNKVMPLREMVSVVSDGDHVAFGGGVLVRKPMAFAAARRASPATGLHLVAFVRGAGVDVLVGLDKVASLGPGLELPRGARVVGPAGHRDVRVLGLRGPGRDPAPVRGHCRLGLPVLRPRTAGLGVRRWPSAA